MTKYMVQFLEIYIFFGIQLYSNLRLFRKSTNVLIIFFFLLRKLDSNESPHLMTKEIFSDDNLEIWLHNILKTVYFFWRLFQLSWAFWWIYHFGLGTNKRGGLGTTV